MKTKIMHFKIHTPYFLKEICDCALPKSNGMLRVPLNDFRIKLCELAELSKEINDPRLHLWCYNMTLYDEADPSSKDYNPHVVKILERQIKQLEKKK